MTPPPGSTTMDYNLVWQTDGKSPEYHWASSTYNIQQSLYAASGQEQHGLVANPLFVNAASGNFQLSAGSPAIDSADASAPYEQQLDVLGRSRVDDPSSPNTGNPAGSFYDRGAYEYQPGSSGSTPQTISFTPPTLGVIGTSVTLTATGGGSGNPVVFAVDSASGSGVCSVSGANGSTLNYLAGGSCVVDANQAGNATYAPALQVQVTIPVNTSAPPGPGSISKVLVIMDENHSSLDVFPSDASPNATMPYLWALAQQYGYANNWSDITNPSEPNYLGIFGGDSHNAGDCTPGPGCQWAGPTVFSQAIAEGGTAKTYEENMSGNCLDPRRRRRILRLQPQPLDLLQRFC